MSISVTAWQLCWLLRRAYPPSRRFDSVSTPLAESARTFRRRSMRGGDSRAVAEEEKGPYDRFS
jgi:hypothetical protein